MAIRNTVLGHTRPGIHDEKFLKKKEKKDTTPKFLHRGPKDGVKSEYHIHFGQILANKIRNGFLCLKTAFFALKTVFLKIFI